MHISNEFSNEIPSIIVSSENSSRDNLSIFLFLDGMQVTVINDVFKIFIFFIRNRLKL